MCGITGFWTQKDRGEIPQIIENMTDTLIHRGPDDSGVWADKDVGIALGHRRLSILDLSPKGHQPMFSHSERFVIVYNGEVYNFKDIKKMLTEEGIGFRTDTDTEVILEAIERYGIDKALTMFNGMFAFSLFDKRERVLYLVRDRVGIKPLYYGINNGIFFFTSELKAIRAHPKFSPILNIDALSLYFRHNYIPAPYSIYKGIFKLTPGHYLSIDKDFNVKDTTYWNFRDIAIEGANNPYNRREEELIEELDTLLEDAVKKRMISNVPLGAFLSGGIDSTTVVSFMQKWAISLRRHLP